MSKEIVFGLGNADIEKITEAITFSGDVSASLKFKNKSPENHTIMLYQQYSHQLQQQRRRQQQQQQQQ